LQARVVELTGECGDVIGALIEALAVDG
jgi:hypothetical protein